MYRTPLLPLAMALCVALAACKGQAPDPAAGANAPSSPAAPAGEQGATAAARVADALNPLPSPKDAMLASMRAFRDVRSYHATMRIEGGPQGAINNDIDFVAPDRYRLTMNARGMQMQSVRIGTDTWMTVGGRTLKSSSPSAPGAERWTEQFEQAQDTMTVEAQGNETIDGVATRKYRVKQTVPQPSEVTVWLNGDDLVEQALINNDYQGAPVSTTIRYTRYNDPSIRIDPP